MWFDVVKCTLKFMKVDKAHKLHLAPVQVDKEYFGACFEISLKLEIIFVSGE